MLENGLKRKCFATIFPFFQKWSQNYTYQSNTQKDTSYLSKLPILGYPLLDGRQSAPV